ncbi:PREDICTED: polyvinylalcohol dehydrogenase [Prunus dulcis]|uniref:PREDICTED: polyvinylalcohol dehydrogenase n=1 Tax=Prunus dulcis TaxID=3755 RepID=A0A5E4EXC8_PRUDU|nr:PREDICTED: polyvinylalcohol dehydrogenase [Prunus dulcis]
MACKQNLMKCHHTIKMVVMVVCWLTLLDATYAIKERCWGSANQPKDSVKHEVKMQNLGALTGLNGTGVVVNVTVSRSTPTIAGNLLIVGIYGPAVVIAVDRSNWRLVWSTQLDPRPRVLITMSGTVHLGLVNVFFNFAVHFMLGCRLCKKVADMLQDNGGRLGGYSGAAVWGSSPAIDISRRPNVKRGRLNREENLPILISALVQISTSIQFWRWIWILGGLYGPGNLADMMFSILLVWYHRDLIWMPTSERHPCCSPYTQPNKAEGGGIWGAATDGRRVYTNIANGDRENFTLAPSSQTTTAGAWVALDADSGEILWTTANPSNDTAQAPVTVANGVVFAGSVASNGPIYAMKANTGRILWSYNTGATV